MKLYCFRCQHTFESDKPETESFIPCKNCGAELPVPQKETSPGVVIGDFAIEKFIGQGGMGEVLLARQISLDRPVALKVIQKQHSDDAEYVESLFREARAAAKISHPNLVQAYAVGEDNGLFYFAMEYINGKTFKQILAQKRVLDFRQAAEVVHDVAQAVNAIWTEQHLVHHDIKPDNIMLDSRGIIKLADLGLAQKSGAENQDGDAVIGTPQYISPEQLTGATTDVRSDIYCLGATFYQFVTGHFAFEAATLEEMAKLHVYGTLKPPREINKNLPQELNDIIVKMLQTNPNDRYQSAKEVIDDLDNYLLQFKQQEVFTRLTNSVKNPIQPGQTPTVSTPSLKPPVAENQPKEKTPEELAAIAEQRRKTIKFVVIVAIIIDVCAGVGLGVYFGWKPIKKYVAEVKEKRRLAEIERKLKAEEERRKIGRPEYLQRLAQLKKGLENPSEAKNAIATAKGFFDSTDPEAKPKTQKEIALYNEVYNRFTEVDEKVNFAPYRQVAEKQAVKSLKERLAIAAEAQRQRAAEAAERRKKELERQKAEKALADRLQAKERETENRIGKLREDLRGYYSQLMKAFYESLSAGDTAAVESAARAAMTFVPSSFNTTTREVKMIGDFRDFRDNLVKETAEELKFVDKLRTLNGSAGISLLINGNPATVEKISAKGIIYRSGGNLARISYRELPTKGRTQLDKALKKRLGDDAAFLYGLLIREVSKESIKDLPATSFWAKHRQVLLKNRK